MESQDEYYNANDLSEDEEERAYSPKEQFRGEEENDYQFEVSSELRKFQMNFYEEISQNVKGEKEFREGGYFGFIFSLCQKWIFKHLEWNPEFQDALLSELETFIRLFKSGEDHKDQAFLSSIINIKNFKNEFLKDVITPEPLRIIDRILEFLERARQWQKETKSLNLKDIYENDVQASLTDFEASVNSLFRSTKEDKLDQCANLMAELDKLRISPHWEESIYRYRLMYKELLWIKRQIYPISGQYHIDTDAFTQAVEACDALVTAVAFGEFDEKVSEFSTVECRIVNGGYFDRRISEIFRIVERSEASLYKALCTILKSVRKLFNYGLQKETFIECIDHFCEPVQKTCQEYFINVQNSPNDKELLIAFEWLLRVYRKF